MKPLARPSPDTTLLDQVRARKWFYEFALPDGTRTECYMPPGVEKVHTTRLAILEGELERRFGGDLSWLTAVDLACNEGWFALLIARRGAKMLGLDLRTEHVGDDAVMTRTC